MQQTKRALIEGTTYIKREKEDAKMRMGGGSWTINLMDVPGFITHFRYITEKYVYEITAVEAHFKGFERVMQGEPKLIVPIKYWTVKEKQA